MTTQYESDQSSPRKEGKQKELNKIWDVAPHLAVMASIAAAANALCSQQNTNIFLSEDTILFAAVVPTILSSCVGQDRVSSKSHKQQIWAG